MRTWIFLSPHFDDVALSAGGLIWEQAQAGDPVEVWTLCAGDPPAGRPLTEYAQMLHILWELGDDAVRQRAQEDAACWHLLGATCRRYTVPDNIYRYLPGTDQAVVQVPDDNQRPLEPQESYLIPPVTDVLRREVPSGWELVAPLAIGHHRDHVLARRAAERLGRPLWYYADFPYLEREGGDLGAWIFPGAETYTRPIGPAGLRAWQDGVACYRSQLPMLWGDEETMRAAIAAYHGRGGGATLWRLKWTP